VPPAAAAPPPPAPAPPPPQRRPPPAAATALPPLLLRAARLGNRSAQVSAARALDLAGAPAAALRWWRRAAKAGHGEAALRYGVSVYRGLGSPMSTAEAWGGRWGGSGGGGGGGGDGSGGIGGGGDDGDDAAPAPPPRRSAAYASPTGREGVEEAAIALARVLRPLVAAVAACEAQVLQQQGGAGVGAAGAGPSSSSSSVPAAAVDAALADRAVHPSLRACPRPLLREALLVHSFIALDGEGATGKSDVEAAVRALRAARALGCSEAAKTLGYLYNTGQFGAASAW